MFKKNTTKNKTKKKTKTRQNFAYKKIKSKLDTTVKLSEEFSI